MSDTETRMIDAEKPGPLAWMARHAVAANLLMLFCIVGGYFMLGNLKKEVMPFINMDIVQITVPYPGASPEEVERGIILAIEENIRGLDGIKEVTATAREGVAIVSAELFAGEDLQRASQEIKTEVDRIRSFPLEAEEPVIALMSHRRQVLSFQLYGDVEEVVLRELAEQARDKMLQHPDITQVELQGIRPLEIAIEISQENLRRYNLTLGEVATRLRRASIELPGGGIKTEGGEILVRMKERRDYGRQFARTPIISAPDGSEVLLEDIAVIKDAFEEVDRYGLYNDKPSIGLMVYSIGEQTPVEIAEAAETQVELLRPTLPAGVQIEVVENMADAYRQRVDLLLRNAAIGLVLVLILLGLFLELRLALWVMMGIPISFLGAMLLLPAAGVSINMISMFAFIMALGIVVDDAIIIGENIYQHHERGLPFMEAAVKGVREMATPVTFSILTNIVAFMPLLFIPGMMGKMLRSIPIVVIVVLIFSLIESLFILPAHLGRQREKRRGGLGKMLHSGQQKFSKGFLASVRGVYGPILDWSLRHRYVTFVLSVSLLIVALAWPLSGRLRFSPFPVQESDFSMARLNMPYGTAVEKTQAIVERLSAGARRVVQESGRPDLLKGIFARVGQGGSHSAQVQVYLAEPKIRDEVMSTQEFTRQWRAAVGPIAGVENLVFAADAGGHGGFGASLTIELSHRDVNVLERASAELAAELRNYPDAKDIDDGFQAGKQQIDFKLKAEGKSLGLTADAVARQVRSAFYGAEVLRQQRGRNELKVMVRLPKEERVLEYNLEEMMLRTPGGAEVPLREVVEADRGRAYTTIFHRDGQRVVRVEANVVPRSRTGEIVDDLKKNKLPELVAAYPGLRATFQGRQADSRDSLASLFGGFGMVLLAMFGMLAIPFRSYLQPLIVMAAIPFGIIGAMFGHIIMGISLSMLSLFGTLALSGVVVNDSLVLIDAANRKLRAGGVGVRDAIRQAAIQRFRPIMLTTLTTFCGLSPMIFERSVQAKFLSPMAISLGFGILFATLITLMLVPALYLIVDDWKRFLSKVGQAFGASDAAPSPYGPDPAPAND